MTFTFENVRKFGSQKKPRQWLKATIISGTVNIMIKSVEPREMDTKEPISTCISHLRPLGSPTKNSKPASDNDQGIKKKTWTQI